MRLSDGRDRFVENTFRGSEWSAPILETPDEVESYIRQFHLVGRKIKDIRMVGHSYLHSRDDVEEYVYAHLAESEDKRASCVEYMSIADDYPFQRSIESDEPLLVKFEDEDVFEIDAPQEPEFCMSMNCIPWGIYAGTNYPNCNAAVIFAPCIGRTVVSVKVDTYEAEKHPMYFTPLGNGQKRLTERITIWLDNGYGIRIEPYFDYVDFECVNQSGDITTIPFRELKKALYNWEDLHDDEVTGYEADSNMLFFGHKGAERAAEPFMTLTASNCESALHISVYDFLLLGWAMTNILREPFDDYGNYQFDSDTWSAILDEAGRILDFDTFDEVFDYLLEKGVQYHGKNAHLWSLNASGASFWNNRNSFAKQLKDVKAWSNLVLPENGTLSISGF